jgi:hypothetical protein
VLAEIRLENVEAGDMYVNETKLEIRELPYSLGE